MTPQNVQNFPSGEVRVFRPDAANPPVWRLAMHLRAPDDADATDLTGTAIDDMPKPFAPAVGAV